MCICAPLESQVLKDEHSVGPSCAAERGNMLLHRLCKSKPVQFPTPGVGQSALSIQGGMPEALSSGEAR